MSTLSEEDFSEGIDNVLEDFDGVERLTAYQKDGLWNFIKRRDVFAIFPTEITSDDEITSCTLHVLRVHLVGRCLIYSCPGPWAVA